MALDYFKINEVSRLDEDEISFRMRVTPHASLLGGDACPVLHPERMNFRHISSLPTKARSISLSIVVSFYNLFHSFSISF